MKSKYYENKNRIRNIAIDFQYDSMNNSYSYSEINSIQNRLEKQARKYGLVREFKENCII